MKSPTAEDHFTTGFLIGVYVLFPAGVLVGYVWKTLEFVFGG